MQKDTQHGGTGDVNTVKPNPPLAADALTPVSDQATVDQPAIEQPSLIQPSSEQPRALSDSTTQPPIDTAALLTNKDPLDNMPPTGMPTVLPSTTTKTTAKKPRAKWFLPALAGVAVLVISGSAYGYMGVYLQSPKQVGNQALKNTAAGYKKFALADHPVKKGAKLAGTFKLTAPVAGDGTMSLNLDDKNFKFLADAGVSGVRTNLEIRGVDSAGDTPDLYLKLSGVKTIGSLLGSQGSSQIGNLATAVDDKWFSVDHTLLDQALAQGTATQASTITSESPQQLQIDIQDINKKMSEVISDRLLSTDSKKAVVIIKESLGKEDFKGRSSQHYKVKVQKQQLRDMVVALKDAVKDTKLKQWLGSDDKTKTFEQSIQFDQLLQSIDSANYDNAEAEVWVDQAIKYVRDVRVNAIDANGKKTGAIDFFLDYKGGDELPFQVNVTSLEEATKGSVNFGITVNQKTSVSKLSVAADLLSGGQKLVGNANITIEGSDDKVNVDKPVGAKNLLDFIAPIIAQLQGGR
jgi:hypothetical protein